jgi:hypothetical protein
LEEQKTPVTPETKTKPFRLLGELNGTANLVSGSCAWLLD